MAILWSKGDAINTRVTANISSLKETRAEEEEYGAEEKAITNRFAVSDAACAGA